MVASRKRRIGAAVLACLILGIGYLLVPPPPTEAPPLTLPSNGAWLSFDFASGKATETSAQLAARLQANHIRDAHFHVRYIGKSGNLRYDVHATARTLNRQMARDAPAIRRFAWLYIGNERGITGVDIADPTIRARIVKACRTLLYEDGFQGLQLDYEICADGNPAFLQLLREIRAATPGKVLSVATPLWVPPGLRQHGWSEEYFTQVARHCDQVAVMAYDSALYSPRLYIWLMRQQVIRVSRAVAETPCRVVLGVPTYTDGGPSHDPRTENLTYALQGVREGMVGNPFADRVEGVAVFADYTTDAGEWEAWRGSLR